MINTYLIKNKQWSTQIAPQYGGNMISLEPQCGAVNGLNIGRGHRVISPGESIYFKIRIEYCVNQS